jgi:GDP-L-fucose synthase
MISKDNLVVLVLGNNGFVGKAVSAELLRRNIRHLGASKSAGLDLRLAGELTALIRTSGATTVINCAAHVGGIEYGLKNQEAIFSDNSRMTLNILEECSLTKVRLINPISNCAYPGEATIFREDEFWDGPVHDSVYSYAQTRRFLVAGSSVYQKNSSLDVINIVFPNIYGPGDHLDPVRAHALGGIISRMIKDIKNGEKEFMVWGTGTPIREWMYISDAANALVNAVYSNSSHEILNLGVGKGISIADLVAVVASHLGFDGQISFDGSKPDGASEKKMEVMFGPEHLNWSPQVNFEDGVKLTTKWFLEQLT